MQGRTWCAPRRFQRSSAVGYQLPMGPPSFGSSALHQTAADVLAATDRAPPSHIATRIALADGVEARCQSQVTESGLAWNRLAGPVLVDAAPGIAKPGRR